jgi:hypothetical protein
MKLFHVQKYIKFVKLDDVMWLWCMHARVANVYMSTIKVEGSTQMWLAWVENIYILQLN